MGEVASVTLESGGLGGFDMIEPVEVGVESLE